MSLAALALRICTVLAVRGRTPAETRVYDSELAPLEDLAADEPKPFVTVAIDEVSAKYEKGQGLLGGTDTVSLVIEAALARRITLPDGEGNAVQLPDTTMGLEAALDLVERRIRVVLSGDPGFAELWRRLVLRLHSTTRVRGGDTREGVRFAARQIVIDVEPIDDPPAGCAPEAGSVWSDLVAALRAIPVAPAAGADPELAAYRGLAEVIDAEMRSPAGLADWQIVATSLGLTGAAVAALGITPHGLDPTTVEPAPLTTVTLPTVVVGATTDADLIGEDWP